MKRAKLHDGRILEFPPETEDSIIDSAVRKELGFDDIEPEKMEDGIDFDRAGLDVSMNGVIILGQIARSLQGILPVLNKIASSNHGDSVSQKIDGMAKMLAESNERGIVMTQEIVHSLSKRTDYLASIVENGAKAVVDAYSAPRVLQRSPDNKTASLRLQNVALPDKTPYNHNPMEEKPNA